MFLTHGQEVHQGLSVFFYAGGLSKEDEKHEVGVTK